MSEPTPKWHDVTVRRRDGFRRLRGRVALAYEHKGKNERHAWALVFIALADFLIDNDLLEPAVLWLMGSAAAFTDPEDTNARSTREWRRSALVSVGMRALTLDGIKRQDAARCAIRSVKGIDAETVLHRYDEFVKGRVKNQEAILLWNGLGQLLPEWIEKNGAEAVAKYYFDLAKLRI